MRTLKKCATGGEQGPKQLAPVKVETKLRKPLVVKDPNDPRLKAYQDSMFVYEQGERRFNDPQRINKVPQPSDGTNWTTPGPDGMPIKGIGTVPVSQYKYDSPVGGNGMTGARFAKPVRPVILQQTSADRKPIITDNPNDPRLRAYQDSLTLYNMSQYEKSLTKKSQDDFSAFQTPEYTRREAQAEAAMNRLRKFSGSTPKPVDTKIDPFGDGLDLFAKPTQPIIYRRSAESVKRLPNGTTIDTPNNIDVPSAPQAVPEQARVIQQRAYEMKGRQPIYGPGNSLIGMADNNGLFYPDYNNTAKRSAPNQGDTEFMNSDQLKAFLKQKGYSGEVATRLKKGGEVKSMAFGGENDRDIIANGFKSIFDQSYGGLPTMAFPTLYKTDQMPTDPASSYQGRAIEPDGKGGFQAKTTTQRGPNVPAAAMTVGAMELFANELENIPDSRVYDQEIQRGTSDSQFGTYNPILSRGFIDKNSARSAPNLQTYTQYQNKQIPNYYGPGSYLPFAEDGMPVGPGMLPDLIAPPSDFTPPVTPSLTPSFTPSAEPVVTPSSEAPDGNNSYQELKSFIKKQEGFMKKAKWDYKQYTNGFGTKAQYAGEEISKAEAERRLDAELMPTVDKVRSKIQVPLTNSQLTAISSIAYNGGMGVVRKLINQINKGADPNMVAGLIKNTAVTVNNGRDVLEGLVRRRKLEAGLFLKQYKEGGEYDLSDAQIEELQSLGYQLDIS